jgi:hypothetical protein
MLQTLQRLVRPIESQARSKLGSKLVDAGAEEIVREHSARQASVHFQQSTSSKPTNERDDLDIGKLSSCVLLSLWLNQRCEVSQETFNTMRA